jgi:hypothetical protein
VESICAAVGLELSDLFPQAPPTKPAVAQGKIELRRQKDDKEDRVKTFASEAEAIAELERRHGEPSHSWQYHSASGEPVGLIVRWDLPEGRKDIRPVSRRGKGWIVGGMARPSPLYRLPDLAPAPQVFVCEGEKATDAARSIGLVATTSPHGANSAAKADWSPLAGKEVVILPDNDDAGRKYADQVARILAKLDPPSQVKVVELPGVPEHGDIVEWIGNHGEAAEPDELRRQIEALVDVAVVFQPEHVVPVIAESTRSPSPGTDLPDRYWHFPVALLPDPLGQYVVEFSQSIGCDPAFFALPLLSALAAAIGATRWIELRTGWREPSILWTALVGDSGTQKSPALAAATACLRERERSALLKYQEELPEHEVAMAKYEKALAAWKRKCDGSDPPQRPAELVAERCLCGDITMEALGKRLKYAPRGLLEIRDELAGWLNSFDQYRSGKGGDLPHWLSIYNATPLIVDRKSEDLGGLKPQSQLLVEVLR